jgi:hypothetical protein
VLRREVAALLAIGVQLDELIDVDLVIILGRRAVLKPVIATVLLIEQVEDRLTL